VQLHAPSAGADACEWEQAEVVYKADRQPFVAEANAGELAREEIDEFVELVEDVDELPEKPKVATELISP